MFGDNPTPDKYDKLLTFLADYRIAINGIEISPEELAEYMVHMFFILDRDYGKGGFSLGDVVFSLFQDPEYRIVVEKRLF